MSVHAANEKEERVQALRDLAKKAVDDTGRALETTLDLANEVAGSEMGMFLIAMRVAIFMLHGCSMAVASASNREVSEQDAWIFTALLCLNSNEKKSIRRSREMFRLITQREPPIVPFVHEDDEGPDSGAVH